MALHLGEAHANPLEPFELWANEIHANYLSRHPDFDFRTAEAVLTEGELAIRAYATACASLVYTAKLSDLDLKSAVTRENTALEDQAHVVIPCRDGKLCVAAELGSVWKSQACGKSVKRENRSEMSLGSVSTSLAEELAARLRGTGP